MKKFRLILSMICLSVFGLIAYQADAQQTKGGTPPTFLVKEAQALPAQAYVKIPVNFSVAELLREDSINANSDGMYRPTFAREIPADITMENSGVWTELPNGQRIWRVAVEAKNAIALIIAYEEFYLPAGSQLFIYSADKTQVLGAYDNTSNSYGKQYSTSLVAGDITVFEYVEPLESTNDKARLKISGIGYAYDNIKIVKTSNAEVPEAGSPGGSNPIESGNTYTCYVDIACSEGDEWRETGSAACFMYLRYTRTSTGGKYWTYCSSTLVNNTANDKTPYIITAWHCGADYDYAVTNPAEDFLVWQFNFFYERSACNTAQTDFDYEQLVGATVVADAGGCTDGLLLKLTQPIPDAWITSGKIYFAGWDRRDIAPTSGTGINFPRANPKKIATYTSPPTVVGNVNYGYGGSCSSTMANGMWLAAFVKTDNGWGRSEAGASGGALFNQNKLLVGTLCGAPSSPTPPTCTATSGTFNVRHAKLSYHWDKVGSTPATQMKTWLDPLGNGTADTCLPYPYADNPTTSDPFNFKADRTDLYALESTTFTITNASEGAFSIDSVKWEFTGGTPAQSIELLPEIAYETATGSPFDVKLTIYSKDTSNNNDTVFEITKTGYITVTVKGTPDMPVANVAALDFVPFATPVVSDDGMISINGSTPTNTSVSSSGNTSTYAKTLVSGTMSSTVLANSSWTRTNNANSSSSSSSSVGNTGYGYGATSATYQTNYFYSYFCYAYSYNNHVRMYNRTALNLDTITAATLKFKFKNRSWSGDWDAMDVQYSNTSASGTWTTIKTIDQATTTTITTGTTGWIDVEVELPNLTSTYYIGFKSNGTGGDGGGGGYGIGIDNIEIYGMNIEEKTHVILWEGDNVDFYDLSTGVPVLYNYEFEGGDPATSTSDAPVINVRYDTEGLYDISQAVKNTLGADTMVREDYVEVISRILKTDTALVVADCNNEIDAYITLTANRNWVATYPVWMQVSPSSGSVAALGTSEDFVIHVTVPAQDKFVSRIDDIVFTSDDNMITATVTVKQASAPPTGLTTDLQNNADVFVSWDEPSCLINKQKASECNIIDVGNGGFEDSEFQEWMTFTEGDGYGWEWSDYPSDVHSGSGAAASFSNYGSGYDFHVDNWLVSPKVKITEDYYTLTYYVMSLYLDSYVDYDYYELRLSTASSITSVEDFDIIIKELAPGGQGSYVKVNVSLSDYIGQEVYIAFRHLDYYKYGVTIDDVSGLELASCLDTLTIEPDRAKSLSQKTSSGRMLSLNKAKISRRELVNEIAKMERTSNRENKLQNVNSLNKTSLVGDNASQPENVLQSMTITGLDDLRKCGDYFTGTRFINQGYNVDGTRAAVKFNEDEIADYSCSDLTAITIAMYTPFDIDLFVQRGDSIIYTQHVFASDINAQAPTRIPLDNPVSLAGEGDLYIGYITPAYTSGYPYGTDSETAVAGGAEIYYGGAWISISNVGNFYIIGHTELEGAIGVFNLYRQRKVHGNIAGAPILIGQNLDTVTYFDENLPGGEYCYWVTFKSNGVESCAGDTSCVFVPYKQTINVTSPINKTYGDAAFKIDKPATDGYLLKSSANDADYFAGRTIPVKLEKYGGNLNALTLSGNPSDYTVTINSAGSVSLRATQDGIPDTLLAAEAEIQVNINKKDLKITADDKTRQEGEKNPAFTFQYDEFVTGEDVNNLDVPPTATCVAGVLSPAGEYPITVNTGNDKNYNTIPVSGILYVIRSDKKINTFTPYDADDINDRFMPNYKMKIFNRYGVLIYETKNKTDEIAGWDGHIQNSNQLVNPGVYYYVAYDDNGKIIHKGSVNVVKK